MIEKLKIVLFMVVVTAVFGTLVAVLQVTLRSRIELNKKVDTQGAILELFGLKKEDEAWDAEQVVETFEAKVRAVPPYAEGYVPPARDEAYRYFTLADASSPVVVFPIGGQGFWDLITGYMAVDPGEKTIRGLAFVKQSETPGLGARITEKEWRAQFAGTRYDRPDDEGDRIRVVPPGTADPDQPEVDAITGATETSRAVERIVNESIDRFLRERKKAHPEASGTNGSPPREEFRQDADGRVLAK